MPERDSLEALEAELRRDRGRVRRRGRADRAGERPECTPAARGGARPSVGGEGGRGASRRAPRECGSHARGARGLLADLAATAAASEANDSSSAPTTSGLRRQNERRGGGGGERIPGPGGRGSLARSRGQGGGASGRPRRGAGASRCRAAGRACRRARHARRRRRDRRRLREGLRGSGGRCARHGRGGRDGRRPRRVAPPATTPACTVACWRQAGRAARAGPSRCRRPRRPSPCVTRVRSGVRGVDAVLDELLAGVLLRRGGLEEALRLAEDLPGYTIVTTGRRSPLGSGLAHRAGTLGSDEGRPRNSPPRRQSAAPTRTDGGGRSEKRSKVASPAPDRRVPKLRAGSTTPPPRWPRRSRPGRSRRSVSSRLRLSGATCRRHTRPPWGARGHRSGARAARSRARESRGRRARGARSRRGGDPRPDRSRRTGPVPRRARGGAGMRAAGLEERATLLTTRRDEVERAPRRPRPGQGRSRSEAGGPRGGSCGARAPCRRARPPRWRAGGGG